MTVAVTQAIFNALDKDARQRWERQRARELARFQPPQTVKQFHSTLGRLATMFPDNVKVH
jgi:hypothetical protein